MIPVKPQPEPATFDAFVRAPGRAFLNVCPKPTSSQYKTKRFWRVCLRDLRIVYSGICAYTASWIPNDCTVDHFLPATKYPELAYEWTNYRLAGTRVNQFKGDRVGLLDPFSIQVGWFVLDCASFYVHPGLGLGSALVGQIHHTITSLDLNCDSLVEMRFEIIREYSQGNITLDFLAARYPFIGAELQRQNLVHVIRGIIK